MTKHFQNHHRRLALTRVCIVAAVCSCAASVRAQDPATTSRSQEPARVSDEQSTDTGATGPGRLRRVFKWGEAQFDGRTELREGWYPEMSGMIPGSGLSIGPGYRQHLFGDHLIVDASAAVSSNGSRMMQSQLIWPKLADDRLLIGSQVTYQDFTQVNFFGVGNATQKGDQTDYRLRDVDAIGFATVRATPWLSLTGRFGALRGRHCRTRDQHAVSIDRPALQREVPHRG